MVKILMILKKVDSLIKISNNKNMNKIKINLIMGKKWNMIKKKKEG